MRKMEVIYESEAEKLTKRINEMYQKAEKLGYQIISTQIIKEPMSIFTAFIDYETKPLKNK